MLRVQQVQLQDQQRFTVDQVEDTRTRVDRQLHLLEVQVTILILRAAAREVQVQEVLAQEVLAQEVQVHDKTQEARRLHRDHRRDLLEVLLGAQDLLQALAGHHLATIALDRVQDLVQQEVHHLAEVHQEVQQEAHQAEVHLLEVRQAEEVAEDQEEETKNS